MTAPTKPDGETVPPALTALWWTTTDLVTASGALAALAKALRDEVTDAKPDHLEWLARTVASLAAEANTKAEELALSRNGGQQ